MKNFLSTVIGILICVAIGFGLCWFLVKNVEPERIEVPVYDSSLKTENDSLWTLLKEKDNNKDLSEQTPTSTVKIVEDTDFDFLEAKPEKRILPDVKISSQEWQNNFEKVFSFEPSDFPEAQTNGDSIWLTVQTFVESQIIRNENDQMLAKNNMKCQIINLYTSLKDASPLSRKWGMLISTEGLFNTRKEFNLGLGAGAVYHPWKISGLLEAQSDKQFGLQIIKEF